MANILKTPVITTKTKLLSFDIESNGLHGDAFAIGAVVLDANGKVYDKFTGRSEIVGKIDEWVEQNVLPVITDMEITHSSYKHLRDNFWAWFVKAKKECDYVLVNNGYPVEYRFLLQCQEDDLDVRFWDHPFPILELTSLIVGAGKDVQETKIKVMSEQKDKLKGDAHHPYYDSVIAIMAAFKVLS